MVSRKKSSQAKSSSPRAQYVNESDHLAKSRAVENDPNATPLEVLHVSCYTCLDYVSNNVDDNWLATQIGEDTEQKVFFERIHGRHGVFV